jgi:phosphomannomutase
MRLRYYLCAMPLIRSISGLRGTVGDSLTPEVVIRYAAAFAEYTGGGTIVVGRDGRPSGAWVEELVIGTLRACGVTAEVLGLAPTPTVQLAAEKSGAAGGISITASHNPSEWNGLKFLNSDGIFLGPDECAEFFALVDDGRAPLASWQTSGGIRLASDVVARHIDATLELPFVDLPALQARAFKVVVDAVNASGSHIVPTLLERCGCDVVRLFCDASGVFPHTPEPLPENLTQLADAVRTHRADVGIAVDPDADRLVLIDENGRPFGEEYTITQAAEFMLGWARRNDPDADLSVVVNLSTTRAIEDVAERHGARVVRTPVGEINVALEMKRQGAIIGGEGSGGVILPSLHYGRDSLAGIIITLSHLLAHGGTMSSLRASLPEYEIVKKKAELTPGVDPRSILERLAADDTTGARATTSDGLRLDFERSWVHMRSSNTEPIVRVIAEAPTQVEADEIASRYMARVQALGM